MGTVVKGLFQGKWQPQLMLVRNRSKINITKPRLPHYKRALVEYVCKPYFNIKKNPPYIPNYDLCGTQKVQKAEKNPYEDFLARQLLNWFQNSKLIAFFHVNSISSEEDFQAKVILKKNGFRLMSYNRKVAEYAVTGTIYEPVNALFKSHTSIGCSQESDIPKLMKVLKKLPKLILMAAVVENRLLNYNELEYYSKIQNIEEARLKLVSTLSAASQNLVQQINHYPSNLVQLLDQHQQLIKDKTSEKTESAGDK